MQFLFLLLILQTLQLVFADQMQKRNELTVKSKIDIEEGQFEVCALNIDEQREGERERKKLQNSNDK